MNQILVTFSDLVTFTKEMLTGKFHFLCSDRWETLISVMKMNKFGEKQHEQKGLSY